MVADIQTALDQFDTTVTSLVTLENVKSPLTAVRKLARVLRPHGQFVSPPRIT